MVLPSSRWAGVSWSQSYTHVVCDHNREQDLLDLGVLIGPPGEQLFASTFLTKRAFLYPTFQQERVRPSDIAALRDAEDFHDLGAVQVRSDGVQLLLSRELGYPTLEVVVRLPQPLGLRGVPRRDIGSGQYVQPRQLITGIADVPANRRVGPGSASLLAGGIPVQPQVQGNQFEDGPDLLAAEPQRRQPLPGELGTHHVMVMERDLATRLETSGRRLADVMQQRRQSDNQIRPLRQPLFKINCLLQHCKGVLIDVLVPVMFIPF